MPIIPPSAPAVLDAVEYVLNLARVRLNDAIASLGGDVLTDTQPFTQPLTNGAWRRMQKQFFDLGSPKLVNQGVVYSLPPVAPIPPATTQDASTYCWMNWSQFFDGYQYFAAPVLPADLIAPVDIWERVTLSPDTGPFYEMDRSSKFAPVPKGNRQWKWEWRNNALQLQGSIAITDLLIRYAAFYPDFETAGPTQWYQQIIPIPRVASPFAWLVAYEVAQARGDQGAEALNQAGMTEIAQVVNGIEMPKMPRPRPMPPAQPPQPIVLQGGPQAQ